MKFSDTVVQDKKIDIESGLKEKLNNSDTVVQDKKIDIESGLKDKLNNLVNSFNSVNSVNSDNLLNKKTITESLDSRSNSKNDTSIPILFEKLSNSLANQYTDSNSVSENNEVSQAKMIGFIFIIILSLINIAFIVCDLYYGLNDTSCATQEVSRIKINLKTFLIVRGLTTLIYIGQLILSINFISIETIKFCGCCQISILICYALFLSAWNIIGAVLFWGYMDNSKCSDNIYNYTFASLIIIFISMASSIFQKNRSENN